MSSRFVAGTRIEDVLDAATSVNHQRMSATLDSLGENVHSPAEAHAGARRFQPEHVPRLAPAGPSVAPPLTIA